MQSSKTKAILLFMLTLTFGVLLFGGYLMHKEKPPIPKTVASVDGRALFGEEDITGGQNHFMSRGGQHMGSIWGHGAYLAPDWSADYLHRQGLFLAGPASRQEPRGGRAPSPRPTSRSSTPEPAAASPGWSRAR